MFCVWVFGVCVVCEFVSSRVFRVEGLCMYVGDMSVM